MVARVSLAPNRTASGVHSYDMKPGLAEIYSIGDGSAFVGAHDDLL
jgi:hypothetical protein